MTTIVYRDGVIAADMRGYAGTRHPLGLRLKIRRLSDSCLVGVSSTKVGQADCVAEWLSRQGKPEELWESLNTFNEISFQAIKVQPNGHVALYDNSGWPSAAEGPYYATGSGEDFAYGALATGVTAIGAVAVAVELDPWSDYPLMYLRHADPEPIILRDRAATLQNPV